MATYYGQFGYLVTGTEYRRVDGRVSFRVDRWYPYAAGEQASGPTYTPREIREGLYQLTAVEDTRDDTPDLATVSRVLGKYYDGERCACCYLGHTHSVMHHNALIARWGAAHNEAVSARFVLTPLPDADLIMAIGTV